MPRRETAVGLLIAALVAGLAGLRAGDPARFETLVATTRRALRDVPDPVVLGVGLVAGTLVWLVGMWLLGRAVYRIWRLIGGRARWLAGLVWPSSPVVRFAVGMVAMLALMMLTAGVLPAVADLGSTDAGQASYADGLSRGAPDGAVERDLAAAATNCTAVEGPDRDDDGLPDRWERAGETPDGAALPGADPDHKDIYVQLDYGGETPPLSDTERRQLRDVWARMPVGNADGKRGIDIHVMSERLDEPAVFTSEADLTRRYTPERLGPRHCVYHSVTVGDVRMGNTLGLGATPGYVVVVDGQRRPVYDGNVSFRVGVTTHELLHNVVGRVDGRAHTTAGWLTHGATDEFLSEPTRAEIAADGLFGPVR